MGPLIDAGSVARFESAVTQAVAQGGRLLCGGKRLERPDGPLIEKRYLERLLETE